jgi:hypothetical protein
MGSPALPPDAGYDLSSNSGDVYRLELDVNEDLFDVELGPPVGKRMRLDNGIWVREYTSGRVYVNPSRYTQQAVRLGAPLTDLKGNRVVDLEMGPLTGVILIDEASASGLLLLGLFYIVQLYVDCQGLRQRG